MRKYIGCLIAAGLVAGASAQEASKTVAGIQFSGFMRYRYEWTENPRPIAENTKSNGLYLAQPSAQGSDYTDAKSQTRTLLWLNLDKQMNAETRFHATLQGEHLGGGTTRSFCEIKEVYVARKMGAFEVALGRFLPSVGLGTLGGAPDNDGINVNFNTDQVSAHAWLTKWGNQLNQADSLVYGVGHATYAYADLQYRPVKPLRFTLSYMADVSSDSAKSLYKCYALGAEYAYVSNSIPWFKLSGEYARNNGEMAKALSIEAPVGSPLFLADPASEKTPVAWFLAAKTLGAHPFRPGTCGFTVQYRHADAGFDVIGMASPQAWNVPFNWSSPSGAGLAENHKGVELSGEVTVFEGAIFKASYGLMKTANPLAFKSLGSMGSVSLTNNLPFFHAAASDSQKYFTAQMVYLF